VMWGVVMALLSILPAVGPALVWVPAAIYLVATGSLWAGVTLVLIGVLVIGLVDNLLRPVLVGRDTRMPDYLILLSTLGGLTAFGLAGIVIGRIIAAFFLSCWEMAQEEFESPGPAMGGAPIDAAVEPASDPADDPGEDTAHMAALTVHPRPADAMRATVVARRHIEVDADDDDELTEDTVELARFEPSDVDRPT